MRIDRSYVSEYRKLFGWHNTSYIQTVDMTEFFFSVAFRYIVKMLQIENFLVLYHTHVCECVCMCFAVTENSHSFIRVLDLCIR